MSLLARYGVSVRTYSSTELPSVPRLARERGLDVTAGAWINHNPRASRDEVEGLIRLARANPNVTRDTLGAAVASMALSHANARGILKGPVQKEHLFTPTAKSRRLRARPNALTAVREETLLFAVLLVAVLPLRLPMRAVEAQLWLCILTAQALPYAASLSCALVSAWAGERSGAIDTGAGSGQSRTVDEPLATPGGAGTAAGVTRPERGAFAALSSSATLFGRGA